MELKDAINAYYLTEDNENYVVHLHKLTSLLALFLHKYLDNKPYDDLFENMLKEAVSFFASNSLLKNENITANNESDVIKLIGISLCDSFTIIKESISIKDIKDKSINIISRVIKLIEQQSSTNIMEEVAIDFVCEAIKKKYNIQEPIKTNKLSTKILVHTNKEYVSINDIAKIAINEDKIDDYFKLYKFLDYELGSKWINKKLEAY